MSASTDRLASFREHRAAPAANYDSIERGSDPHGGALVLLIIVAAGLAILPDALNYLNVQHVPTLVGNLPPPIGVTAQQIPLAHVARQAGSIVLFLVSLVALLTRGHPDRNLSGAIILLLGLLFPYITSPALPGRNDFVRVVLAAAVIVAIWHVGASIDVLKWVPITGSLIATYSIIGGLIAPGYMMFGKVRRKALIGDIQLAGPFPHSNALGIYCALALALIPLIVSIRWRVLHGLILCMAIVASASRTALVIAGVVLLWWVICWFRSVISIRVAGTALIGLCAAIVLVLPLLTWNPGAFTGRAYVWAESLSAWQESRLVGLGVNWFTSDALSSASVANWAYVGSGHNLVVDTLTTSGVVGICVLVLVLFAAIRSVRAFEVTSHQIACFGHLIAFLVASTTEAIWVFLPHLEMFPVVGLVFAVVVVTRHQRDSHPGNLHPFSRVTTKFETEG
jgi:hypothetical protein